MSAQLTQSKLYIPPVGTLAINVSSVPKEMSEEQMKLS